MNPEDILSAINRISSNTVEQLEQFSNFEWEAPSRCHMWANKDVAAHLVATLGFNLNSITMALSGNHLPGEGMPNPGTFHSSEIAPGIASRAIQLSETSLRNKTTLLKVLSDIQQDFNWAYVKNVTKLVDELDRINKEGPGLFDNKIVQEKVRHNQDLFYKRTTTDRLLSKLREWYQ